MDNVMSFIIKYLNHFLKRDSQGLKKLNDVTDGRFLDVLANNRTKLSNMLDRLKRGLKQVKMF